MSNDYSEVIEKFGEKFNKITDIEEKERTIDPILAANLLMKLYWTKHYNGDLVLFVGGPEGCGKSTLARSIAKLLDPEFDHTKILYSYSEIKQAFFNDKEWECIVYDESQEGVDRRESPSKGNREFAAFFRQARQKHKIFIMCGPSIYDIDSYVALHRVTFLLQCYLKDGLHPGHGIFYTAEQIKRLFVFDKRVREYNQKSSFRFYFSNLEVCDMEAYNSRKKQAFEKFKAGTVPITYYKSEDEIIREYRRGMLANWNSLVEKSKTLRPIHFYTSHGVSRTTFKMDWDAVSQVQKLPKLDELEAVPESGMSSSLSKRYKGPSNDYNNPEPI